MMLGLDLRPKVDEQSHGASTLIQMEHSSSFLEKLSIKIAGPFLLLSLNIFIAYLNFLTISSFRII